LISRDRALNYVEVGLTTTVNTRTAVMVMVVVVVVVAGVATTDIVSGVAVDRQGAEAGPTP